MSNYSKQREEICNILRECNSHPSAYEIYEMSQEKKLGMSKSTVYRNLKVLSDCGKILKIEGKNGCSHYDWVKSVHCHALCRQCGRIFDFDYEKILKIKESAVFQLRGNFDEVAVTVSGICAECMTKNKQTGI